MAKIKVKLDKRGKIVVGVVSGLLAVAILVGCLFAFGVFAGDEKVKENDKTEEVENPPVEEEKTLQIVDVTSNSRPYAVMINNISTARPYQSGLQDAYIVYEIIVEGGITRLLALFKDQETERIGSIRSARHYYLDYTLENDAIYVYHGQSPQAQADFSSLGITRIAVDNSKTGWRDKTLKISSEHTLFTSIAKLENGLGDKRTESEVELLLNYSVDEVDLSKLDGAVVANDVAIPYSSSTVVNYKYDAENKVYLRYYGTKEHTDYVTKEQYTVKNIITYQVKNYTLNDPENKGRQGLDNIGTGTGYYISNGYAVPIKWEKKSRSAQTKYMYMNGEEIDVNDGNTYIQIQPIDQTLNIS